MKTFFKKSETPKLKNSILILCVIVLSITIFVKLGVFSNSKNGNKNTNFVEEIEKIKSITDVAQQSKYYRELIIRVGPEKAQDELFRSGLPFTGQTHLLNHEVGNYLYEKFGSGGLLQCKDYFLSSCYHGFLLNVIANGGLPEVAKSFVECQKAGPTTSSQCAHGIGHGFLANEGYKNLTDALKVCDTALASIPGFPAFNCYDGIFMENIWAVHDGAPSPDRWVKPDDPMYPCNDPRIEDKYLLGCWSNQPSLAYQLFRGDIKKVADNVCVKVKQAEFQNMCFDGLARQIHPLTNGSATKTIELCGLMPSQKWKDFCVSVNAGASYSVGDRTVPFEVCSLMDSPGKTDCYGRVFSMMKAYKKPGDNLRQLCNNISDSEWRQKCHNNIN